MVTNFLLLVIGGCLLGCVAFMTTIIVATIICGFLKGCAAVCKSFRDRLSKWGRQIPRNYDERPFVEYYYK